MNSKLLAAVGLSLASASAYAVEGAVGAYYTMSNTGFAGDLDSDGGGFGLNGQLNFGQAGLGSPFASFEYRSVSEDFDANSSISNDIDTWRIGGGYRMPINQQWSWSAGLEYANVDWSYSTFEYGAKGLGIHVGADVAFNDAWSMRGALGYLDLKGDVEGDDLDNDGLELEIGVNWQFAKEWGASLDYRSYMGTLSESADTLGTADNNFELTDLMLGINYSFGK